MSGKIKNRLIILMATLFACATLCCFGLFFAKANEAVLIGVELHDNYSVGDVIEIPDGKIRLNDKEYDASAYILLPDGSAKNVKSYTFTASGIHELIYYASADGKTIKKSVKVNVINNQYEVPIGGSSAVYGTNPYLPESRKGINLSLKDGESFTFNKLIDVSGYTKKDKIIEFYVTPQENGSPEFNEMLVTLTDLYDKNNKVTVRYSCVTSEVTWSWCYIYTSAKANDQKYIGIEYYPDRTDANIGNKYFVFHTNNKFGFPSRVSYNGVLENNRTFEENCQYLSMDYQSKKIYAQYAYYKSWGDANMVTDLDDPLFYDNNLWKGFTTGEVLLSVSFNGYLAGSANVFITQIADYDLSEQTFEDKVAPIIQIDYDGYNENSLPECYVGKPYTVFGAKAYDNILGEVPADIKVYYNYYGDSRVSIPLKGNVFVPEHEGKYTIVYTASDANGNRSEKLLDISASEPQNTLSLTIEPAVDSFEFGKEVKVADFGVTGANGRYEVSLIAELKGDSTVRYSIDKTTLKFMPEYAGEYTIKFIAKDYTSISEKSYDVTVEKPSAPVFIGSPQFPRWVIKSAEYRFESFNAYDYSDGTRKSVAADIYVSEDGGEVKPVSGNYKVEASKKLTVIYKAVGANGNETEKKFADIDVVNTNYGDDSSLDVREYFRGNGFTSSIDEKALHYTKKDKLNGDNVLHFIREIYAYDFAFNFAFKNGFTDFGKMSVILTDKSDSENVLKITFIQAGRNVSFYVNDYVNKTFTIAKSVGEEISLNYSIKQNAVTVDGTTSFALGTVDGLFEGFKDKFVDMEIRFDDVNGPIGVSVYKVLSQRFYEGVIDFIPPSIVIDYQDTTIKALGETLTLKKLRYYDVIDPNVKVTLKVKDSDGTFVTADDGTVLNGIDNSPEKDYTITFKNYGIYYVQYNASDYSWNDKPYSYTVTVKDMVAPEVSLSDGYKTNAKVNEVVKIAKINVSDSSEYRVHVMLIDSESVVKEVEDSFTATKAGKYTVIYYVVDAEQNATMTSYEVIVK